MLVAIVSQNCFVLVFIWGGGRGIALFWGVLASLETVSRDMGYRSDSIAASRDMWPLRADSKKRGLKI